MHSFQVSLPRQPLSIRVSFQSIFSLTNTNTKFHSNLQHCSLFSFLLQLNTTKERVMMMNILALFLVLSSIGVRVLSPNPEKKNSRSGGGGEDVIVKEAHRVVFIEYEREIQPNNKKQEYERVEEANQKPITDDESSPSWGLAKFQNPFEIEQRGFQSVSSSVENANEMMREASSVLPNLGHGISGESLSKACEMTKQVVDDGLDKAKDLTSYKAHLVEEGAKGAKSAVIETGKKIEKGYEKTKEAFEGAKESATESLKKIPQRLAEKIQWEKELIGDAKEKILEKTQDLNEGIGDVKDKTKKTLKGKWKVLDKAYDDLKEAAEETATDASERIGGAINKGKENILEKTSAVEEAIEEEAKEKIPEKLREAKDKILDLKGVTEETAMKAKETVSDKAHLFKEAAAGAKDTVSRKAHEFKEGIEEAAAETPKKVSEGFDQTKEMVMNRMPETIGKASEQVSEKAHEFKEAIEEAAAETPKKVSEGFDQAKEMVMNRMPETIGRASEQVSEKGHEFKEAMKETAAMGAPREEVSEGLFSKYKEKVLDNAHELEASSKESIETATERAKRFLVDLKKIYNMIAIGLTDDRSAKVKTTHFFIEGSRNFTSLFTRSFLSVYRASDETVNWSVGVLRLMGLATAYGSCVWVTFVSSHVLSGALPRQQYGMVQSKIYPVYFRVMASTLGLSFLGHFLTRHHEKSSPSEKLPGYDLIASIGLVLVNLFFLEPLATKVMHDIMKWEKEEGRGIAAEPSSVGGSRMVEEVEAEGFERLADGEVREADRAQHQVQLERLNKRLKKLNTISAFCNILTLMVLTSHLASLSHCLYASCS